MVVSPFFGFKCAYFSQFLPSAIRLHPLPSLLMKHFKHPKCLEDKMINTYECTIQLENKTWKRQKSSMCLFQITFLYRAIRDSLYFEFCVFCSHAFLYRFAMRILNTQYCLAGFKLEAVYWLSNNYLSASHPSSTLCSTMLGQGLSRPHLCFTSWLPVGLRQ